MLTIGAPRNLLPLASGARRSLLLAGGIVVSPLLSIAEELQASGDFDLHYCARSIERTAFRERLASSAFNGRVHFPFDDGPPQQRADVQLLLPAPQEGTHLYVCEPAGFVDAMLAAASAWLDRGLLEQRVLQRTRASRDG